VMGRRTPETKYWQHLQNRMWEVLHGFKDGDMMLSIDELHT
jgi:G:T/U-mismatch repair DNA glycosylase